MKSTFDLNHIQPQDYTIPLKVILTHLTGLTHQADKRTKSSKLPPAEAGSHWGSPRLLVNCISNLYLRFAKSYPQAVLMHEINIMLSTPGEAFFVCLLILAETSGPTFGKKNNNKWNIGTYVMFHFKLYISFQSEVSTAKSPFHQNSIGTIPLRVKILLRRSSKKYWKIVKVFLHFQTAISLCMGQD